jgi:hypothetical protein
LTGLVEHGGCGEPQVRPLAKHLLKREVQIKLTSPGTEGLLHQGDYG